MIRIAGDSGVMLASRLAYATLFGPIFAWYLLARGVDIAVKGATDANMPRQFIVKY